MIKIIQASTDTVLTMQYAHVNSVLTTSAYGGGALLSFPFYI